MLAASYAQMSFELSMKACGVIGNRDSEGWRRTSGAKSTVRLPLIVSVSERLACAPLAVQLSKELAMWGLDQPTLADALANQVEHPSFRRWMASEDAREGPKAFAEKRKLDPAALDRRELEAFVRSLMASGLSPRSTARAVACIRGFYRFLAVEQRLRA